MNHTLTSRGFTILEMLTVIFIIGVLSTVVISGLSSSRMKARDDERVADLAQLQLALEMYYNACGRQYPQALVTTANDGCSGTTDFGNFMKQVPEDPSTDDPYGYGVNADPATEYVIQATFETAHRALSDSQDSSDVLGINCEHSLKHYCVKP